METPGSERISGYLDGPVVYLYIYKPKLTADIFHKQRASGLHVLVRMSLTA